MNKNQWLTLLFFIPNIAIAIYFGLVLRLVILILLGVAVFIYNAKPDK